MNDLDVIERDPADTPASLLARLAGLTDGLPFEETDDDVALIARAIRLAHASRGAVEALEQITDPECMIRGTGGWIDTDAPARIAQNALDALRGQ